MEHDGDLGRGQVQPIGHLRPLRDDDDPLDEAEILPDISQRMFKSLKKWDLTLTGILHQSC
jgi:hypothetical protein